MAELDPATPGFEVVSNNFLYRITAFDGSGRALPGWPRSTTSAGPTRWRRWTAMPTEPTTSCSTATTTTTGWSTQRVTSSAAGGGRCVVPAPSRTRRSPRSPTSRGTDARRCWAGDVLQRRGERRRVARRRHRRRGLASARAGVLRARPPVGGRRGWRQPSRGGGRGQRIHRGAPGRRWPGGALDRHRPGGPADQHPAPALGDLDGDGDFEIVVVLPRWSTPTRATAPSSRGGRGRSASSNPASSTTPRR